MELYVIFLIAITIMIVIEDNIIENEIQRLLLLNEQQYLFKPSI